MDQLSDLVSAVQSDLSVTSNSSLFPEATIKSAINRAYNKAGSLFKWTALQDSQTTSTVALQEYYEAPSTWRPYSIWRLDIDGVMYGQDPDGSPMSFDDFLIWKSDNPSSTDTKWAVQWLRYFVHPIPTVSTSTITIWGYKNVEELTDDTDITIFSYNLPECNDAIVLEASAILQKKGDDLKTSQFVSAEAKQILSIAYNRIKGDSSKQEKIQPFFYVPDYWDRKSSNYNYDPKDF